MAVTSGGGSPSFQSDYQLALEYRFSIGPLDRVHPVVGASVGIGLWDGCINGDLCGGIAAAFSGLAGVAVPLSEQLRLDALVEGNFHGSLPNAVEIMIMPTLWFGVTITPGLRQTTSFSYTR